MYTTSAYHPWAEGSGSRRGEKRGKERGKKKRVDARDRNSEGKAGVSKLYRVAPARDVYLMPSF